jgi:hypothetical protein
MSVLQDLVATITSEVENLTQLGYNPTFAESSAPTIGDNQSAPENIQLLEARNRLINAASDLLHLAQGPVDHIVTLAYGVRFPSDFSSLPHSILFGV